MKKPCRSKRQRKKLLKKAGWWLPPEEVRIFMKTLIDEPALLDSYKTVPMHEDTEKKES